MTTKIKNIMEVDYVVLGAACPEMDRIETTIKAALDGWRKDGVDPEVYVMYACDENQERCNRDNAMDFERWSDDLAVYTETPDPDDWSKVVFIACAPSLTVMAGEDLHKYVILGMEDSDTMCLRQDNIFCPPHTSLLRQVFDLFQFYVTPNSKAIAVKGYYLYCDCNNFMNLSLQIAGS